MSHGDSFLHWGSGSSICIRAMIALNEKGFGDIRNKCLSFMNKEHKSEEVLKLNPRGELPTLKLEGIIINESAAICEYLESEYKDRGTKLLPADRKLRAEVMQRKAENGPGSYLVGKEFSTADIFLISTLMAFVRFGPDINKFPSLKEYYERVQKRESVQKAWPPHWKTDPPNMIMLHNI